MFIVAPTATPEATSTPAPTLTPGPTPTPTPTTGAASNVKVGDCITFGHYPQTSSGTDSTPIEWLVLDVDTENNTALVISKYGLDAKPYNTEYANVTWETCSLRTWLNNEFMNKAFTAAEQAAILTTTVDNSSSQGWSDTNGGNNTQDKIFLLSYAEANKYFGVRTDADSIAAFVAASDYAVAQGAWRSPVFKT